MSAPLLPDPLSAPPAEDARAVSRACRTKILEREGIAMFLALHDARPGRRLEVRDEVSAAEGVRLAELFAHYDTGLREVGEDPAVVAAGIEGAGDPADVAEALEVDPTGAAALIDVLVVLSDRHLQAPPGGGA